MNGMRSSLQLAILFVVGLGGGIWAVIAPWVIPYPTTSGTWTSSIWAATWVGAIVVAASGVGLVIALASAVAEATRQPRSPESR